MQLNDVYAIVTGAGSGLGRHFATRLVEQGASVMACDIDEKGLRKLSEEASQNEAWDGRLVVKKADVSDEGEVIELVEATAEALGSVNVLINNAGIFRDALLVRRDRKTGEVHKMSLAEWQEVIDVDLTGPFLCTREVVAHMVRRDVKPGCIVNISSVSRHGNQGQSNYSAAKAGLVADTKLWAEELSRYGIRVGAVAPGFVDTPILRGMRTDVLEKMLSRVPLGRAGQPEEIYQAVRFILECDYFTGRCVDVDGGVNL